MITVVMKIMYIFFQLVFFYVRLTGISNTAGTLAAITGTVGAGFFVERMGSFKGFLILTSFLYFISTLLWNIFATGEQIDIDGAGDDKLRN